MLVVADSSPLIVLIHIEHVAILPALFNLIFIPPQVSKELKQLNRPAAVRNFATAPPTWLIERMPSTVEAIASLHAGEVAAISLAKELKADLLLIDDKRGREAAAARKLRFTGTIGILELAADRRLLDLADAFERVKRTDFWISHKLLDQRLKLHQAKQQG